jgi:hypothetical protein
VQNWFIKSLTCIGAAKLIAIERLVGEASQIEAQISARSIKNLVKRSMERSYRMSRNFFQQIKIPRVASITRSLIQGFALELFFHPPHYVVTLIL